MRTDNWLQTLRLRLRSLFRRDAVERELDEELRDHLERKTAQYVASGLSPEDARRSALRDMDGLEFRKEQCRDARRVNFVDNLLRDFRHSARSLRKSPGFTLIAVLILTLGIGANVAIFSMVNALLLHPYDYPDLDRLVLVWETRGVDTGVDYRDLAPADADAFRSASSFTALATYRYADLNLSISGNAEPVRVSRISSNLFPLLGVAPILGASFTPANEQPGSDDVAVLSYPLWQRQFAGDPAVVGKTFRLNGRVHTVIGVMPNHFAYPIAMQLWVPLALSPQERANRADLTLLAIARLKPGISRSQALAELDGLSRRLQQQYPQTNAGRSATLLELRKELYAYSLPLFLLLQAAALFVLLLACANLTNLLFARILGRQKEIAVRAALGAGRFRMSVLFISETLLLSLVSGVIATGVSFWTVDLLRSSISPGWTMWVPGWDSIHVDSLVLFFTLGVTLLVGVVFGLATVSHAAAFNLNTVLKDVGRGEVSRSKTRVRNALIVAQVALALVLLVCAGLTAQGFKRLAAAYQGFDPTNVLNAEVVLPRDAYSDKSKIVTFYNRLLLDTRALPGVTSAALVSNPPASNVNNEALLFTIEGRPSVRSTETPSVEREVATAGYFETLHASLISGRTLSEADAASAPPVVVISQAMATRFWPGGDALGHRVRFVNLESVGARNLQQDTDSNPWLTIVGVVADLRQNWWNPVARPVLYRPLAQAPLTGMNLLLRSNDDPRSHAAVVRAVIRRLDPDVAIPSVNTFEHEIEDSIAIIRILGLLMGIFGLVALALASVGVYGVLSEAVAQRTREIGIRISLGAENTAIRRLILGQALKLAAIGLLIGIPISLALNGIMANTLFGVVPLNPVLVAAFATALLFVSCAAAYLPARRAMRLDPIRALRYE